VYTKAVAVKTLVVECHCPVFSLVMIDGPYRARSTALPKGDRLEFEGYYMVVAIPKGIGYLSMNNNEGFVYLGLPFISSNLYEREVSSCLSFHYRRGGIRDGGINI